MSKLSEQDVLNEVYDATNGVLKTSAQVTSDIQIGAVELKDHDGTDRAAVNASNQLEVSVNTAAGLEVVQDTAADLNVTEAAAGNSITYVASAGADNVIKASAGYLHSIILGKWVSGGVVEVSDHASDGDGNVVIYLESGATDESGFPKVIPVEAAFSTGITADITSTTNVTFIYR